MSAPIALVPKIKAADEVRDDVVKLLREVLVEAEAGNIETVIIISAHPDGKWSDECSATNRFSEAIGRLEITKQAWIKKYQEENERA